MLSLQRPQNMHFKYKGCNKDYVNPKYTDLIMSSIVRIFMNSFILCIPYKFIQEKFNPFKY